MEMKAGLTLATCRNNSTLPLKGISATPGSQHLYKTKEDWEEKSSPIELAGDGEMS